MGHHLPGATHPQTTTTTLPNSALVSQCRGIRGAHDESHSLQSPRVNFCSSRSWKTAHLQALPGIIRVQWNRALFKSQQDVVRWVKGRQETLLFQMTSLGLPTSGENIDRRPNKRVIFIPVRFCCYSLLVIACLQPFFFVLKWIHSFLMLEMQL